MSKEYIDIIYIGRNKFYGSYVNRKKYLSSLIFATVLSCMAFFLCALWFFYLSHNKDNTDKEMWYFYEIGNDNLKNPNDVRKEIAGGGCVITKRNFAPIVTDSFNVKDTMSVNEVGSKNDSTGSGGDGDGIGDGSGDYFLSSEILPSFPGGVKEKNKYFRLNIKYPPVARRNKTQGTVYLSFIVETNGDITNIKVLRGIGDGCDEEAVRVVKQMPPWKPGKQNGYDVRVQVVMPLVFSLGNNL